MSKMIEFEFCELPETPREFDVTKFRAGDPDQKKLYNDSKVPRRKKKLTYTDVSKDDGPNYARVVPEDCVFIDYDDPTEAAEMYEIIVRSKLKCLILETVKGYHFLFRKPDFYKKEMTRATNWFGYKFDTKGPGSVQIMKVCGMERDERCSWDPLEPILAGSLNIETLDILPYWLWGRLKDSELHKGGKTGDRSKDDAVTYTLTDTPFTQLMKLTEGSRHNHIVERCSYFGLSNGFELPEFKDLILAIHDQYLVKIGSPMSYSDLFGDLEDRWEDYKAMLSSEGWVYDDVERHWKKISKKSDKKIDERRAAEIVFKTLDCYAVNKNRDGSYEILLHRNKDGTYDYRNDRSERWEVLRDYSDQNFKEAFYKEVEVQLMQLCVENKKFIRRAHDYIIVKNKVLGCLGSTATERDFSSLEGKVPTDVVLPWNWYSEEWVEEHKDDLGGLITKFIKDLARDSRGVVQPEVEQWLWVAAGACMTPMHELEKIIILSGGGSNGKSVFTSLIRFCLGDDMFNTAKIFESSPYDGFWGATLDKGICCVVDDLIKNYNKDAFSYLKGPLTGSEPVKINEKYKPEKQLQMLPQIIVCTNFDFELYDKTTGMQRRLVILPTEYEIAPEDRDGLKQYKLVLNTEDEFAIADYIASNGGGGDEEGTLIMKMRTREKGVLDSLDHGSLAWFANKARYEYFKAKRKKFILGESAKMKEKFEEAFSGGFDNELVEFLEWYAKEKHEDIWTKELYNEYEDWHNEMATGEGLMREKAFSMKLGKAIETVNAKCGYKLEMRKALNDKRMSLNKLFMDGGDSE